jgi:outer membrane biosynthesis protein TonB
MRHSCASILLAIITVSAVRAETAARIEPCNPMPSLNPERIPPVYPPIIERFRWQGEATISFLITIEGRVESPDVSFSEALPENSKVEMDRALQDFARQIRFPRRQQACMGKLKIRFRDGPEVTHNTSLERTREG